LGLNAGRTGHRAAKISYQTASNGRVLTTAVEPSSKGGELVYLAINAEHRITDPPPGEFRQFDLTPLLNESFPVDYQDARQQVASVLDALNALKEGQ
jgi:hypothetical protein